jgi:hypothetical protein
MLTPILMDLNNWVCDLQGARKSTAKDTPGWKVVNAIDMSDLYNSQDSFISISSKSSRISKWENENTALSTFSMTIPLKKDKNTTPRHQSNKHFRRSSF